MHVSRSMLTLQLNGRPLFDDLQVIDYLNAKYKVNSPPTLLAKFYFKTSKEGSKIRAG